MAPLASLDAYLARIGLPGRTDASLGEVHRAQATTIAFENLDSYSGRAPSLEPADLEDKLVARRRGGYCFEQNLLLAGALESLGLGPIEPMLARVRLAPEGPEGRPLDHLLLRVTDRDGRAWLADVGFGGGGLLDPIPFETGIETDQSGWRYRLVEDGPELVLQTVTDGDWTDMYGFVAAPVPRVDVAVSNWYTATHPTSQFVNGVMAGLRSPDRCLTLFMRFISDQILLIERPVGGASTIAEVPVGEVPALLASRFDVEGVSVGDDGRLVLTEAAPGR